MSAATASKSPAWNSLGELLSRDSVVVDPQTRTSWARQHEAINRAESELDDVLAVGLIGGTGVGKSTLINALAGAAISAAGDRRPTTDRVVVYRHAETAVPERIPSAHLGTLPCTHEIASLRRVMLLDFPDFDSVEREHRHILDRYLPHLDLLVVVVDDVKYGDHRLYDLLRALLQSRDNVYFVLNKVDGLAARYGDRWEQVVQEMTADLRAKLAQYAGWSPRDDAVLPLSALVAFQRATDPRGPTGSTEPSVARSVAEFPRLVALLEDYRVERRRRVVKELNIESQRQALVEGAYRVIASDAVAHRVAAAGARWKERRVQVEATMTELGTGAMSELERRRAVRRRLRDNVAQLGFAIEMTTALWKRVRPGVPDGGAVGELNAARWAEHYVPFLEAVRNSRIELDLELGEVVEFGQVEDAQNLFTAATVELQTGLAGWEASLRRQSKVREHVAPVVLLLAWLGLRYLTTTVLFNLTTLTGAVLAVLAGYLLTAWMSWRHHTQRIDRTIRRAESAAAKAAGRWGDRQLDPPSKYLERWLKEREELRGVLEELRDTRSCVVASRD